MTDLQQQLQAKQGFQPSKLTIGLGAVVLVVAAFFAGMWVDSSLSGKNAAGPAANRQFPGGGGQRGGGGGQFPGGRGTVGTVDHVDGGTVYLKARDGSTTKVTVSGDTKVQIPKSGAASDLTAGSVVVVQGDKAEDGTVTAKTITEQAQNK
ncbi:hypothetical protein D5S17_28675 [Pseudonocardiaceae bacterium YIM PH 21723]|nr:hypothetical protein D5S17_28675 [Pseudonocardiaceae bacterium YIM PH 21723]